VEEGSIYSKIKKHIKEEESDGSSANAEEDEHFKALEKNMKLQQTKVTFAMVAKFYMQWLLLLIVHGFVFWYFPTQGNYKLQNHAWCEEPSLTGCNEFGGNWALIMFYLFYCCYFWLSAVQIRLGLPEIRKGNIMMSGYSNINRLSLKGFMSIPFIFELKTFADWTFTKTSLDVFQWFILNCAHAELFLAKCLQGNYQRKPLGKPIPGYLKFGIGVMGQAGIILLIAGPLLLFSSFNPISEANPVKNASFNVNIQIQKAGSSAKNTINLFSNNYLTELAPISYETFHTVM
jgi:hypothetical protein